MNTIIHTIKKNTYIIAAFLVAFSAVLPALLAPLSASAAQITTRSVKMSSAQISATAVTYETKFTTATTGVVQGVIVDFCAESPIQGATCTKPTGLTVGTGTVTTAGLTAGTWTASVLGTKALEVKNASGASIPSGTAVTVSTTGYVNPSTDNQTFYARIFTYATTAAADAYISATPGAAVDSGGVAMSTSSQINVSATVMETLNFCVFKTLPAAACAGSGAPTIVLGTGTPQTINDSAVFTDTAFFQVSSNGQSGTVVNMKGTATLTSGANTIAASGTAQAITAGSGKFGVNVSASSTGGTGTVTAAAPYTNAGGNYGLQAAVTSTYGDTIASSTGPLSSTNSTMTFGVSAASTTPAGIYTASYSLIATSTY